MKKGVATNTFLNGLVSDFNPLITPDGVLTNCLNGTIITNNGNTNVLQNDMGNGRVESAYLPEGYVPLGTAELGGIIYIVSYNPLKKKCQIGSFPSPERNFTSDEVSSIENIISINENEFRECKEEGTENWNNITSPLIKKKLSDIVLNPGDKFIVCGYDTEADGKYTITNNISSITHYDESGKKIIGNINFRLAIIDNNGRLIYLDNLRKYNIGDTGKQLHIKEGIAKSDENTNLDDYRKLISADYQVFNQRIAGELYIVGLLEVIDSIDVGWELKSITKDIEWNDEYLKNPDYHNIRVSENPDCIYTINFNIETKAREDIEFYNAFLTTENSPYPPNYPGIPVKQSKLKQKLILKPKESYKYYLISSGVSERDGVLYFDGIPNKEITKIIYYWEDNRITRTNYEEDYNIGNEGEYIPNEGINDIFYKDYIINNLTKESFDINYVVQISNLGRTAVIYSKDLEGNVVSHNNNLEWNSFITVNKFKLSNEGELNLNVNDTYQLTCDIEFTSNSDFTNPIITWKSNNETVVKIDSLNNSELNISLEESTIFKYSLTSTVDISCIKGGLAIISVEGLGLKKECTIMVESISEEQQPEEEFTTNGEDYAFNFFVNSNDPTDNTICDVNITPYYPFGILQYLKQTIRFDFSLLGIVDSTIWRYYQDSNRMLVSFDLNNYNDKPIENVEIKFIDLILEKKGVSSPRTYTHVLSKRKFYSGVYTEAIIFDEVNFVKDLLYRVEIKITLVDGSEDNPDIIKHYMYTNGVFNDYFIKDSSKINFDNEYLPLNPLVKFRFFENGIQFKTRNVLKEGSLYSTKPQEKIRGYTEYYDKGKRSLGKYISFENTFNDTFGIESSDFDIDFELKSITEEDRIRTYSGKGNIDPQYIIKPSDDILTLNILEDNTVEYNLSFKSYISATSNQKYIYVENYYRPLLYDKSDLQQFGLIYDENEINDKQRIKFANEGVALGISGGGGDNNGGGGSFNMCGKYTMSPFKNTLFPGYLENKWFFEIPSFLLEGSIYRDSGTKGLPINKFPNSNINDVIKTICPNSDFCPILLKNVGSNYIKFRFDPEDEDDAENDIFKQLSYANTISSYSGPVSRRLGFTGYEDPYRDNPIQTEYGFYFYTSFWIFVKIADDANTSYYPLNWLIKVDMDRDSGTITYEGMNNYVELFHNLYAIRKMNYEINAYTVDDYSYIDRKLTLPIEISGSYQNANIFFNGEKLYELGNTNCFKLSNISEDDNTYSDDNINYTITYLFDIKNDYVQLFLESVELRSVTQLVENGILPPDKNNQSDLYQVVNNKLVPISENPSMNLQPYKIIIDENDKIINGGEIEGSLSDAFSYMYNNLNMFRYNISNNVGHIELIRPQEDLEILFPPRDEPNNSILANLLSIDSRHINRTYAIYKLGK